MYLSKAWVYHVITLIPVVLLQGLWVYGFIHVRVFAAGLLLHCSIIWPIISYYRLKALNINVTPRDMLRTFTLIRFKYYTEMLFANKPREKKYEG